MKRYIVPISLFMLTACNSGGSKEETKKEDTATKQTSAPAGKIDIESFGDLKIGQHHKETLRILGNPDIKTPPIEWGADGLNHEDWTYRTKGLALNMSSEIGKGDSTRSLFTINATAPCTYKTRANVGIGNTYDEVQAAYKGHINTEMTTPEQIVVGEIYGGIIFTFDAELKVNRVFLGAAAE